MDNLGQTMTPDDEILFGRVVDDSRTCSDGADAFAIAEFELHGATLRSLMRWYPNEARVLAALAEWELSSIQLGVSERGVCR